MNFEPSAIEQIKASDCVFKNVLIYWQNVRLFTSNPKLTQIRPYSTFKEKIMYATMCNFAIFYLFATFLTMNFFFYLTSNWTKLKKKTCNN